MTGGRRQHCAIPRLEEGGKRRPDFVLAEGLDSGVGLKGQGSNPLQLIGDGQIDHLFWEVSEIKPEGSRAMISSR